MKTQDASANDITRRNFMKKSAMSVGAITLLGQGIGFSLNGRSGGCPKMPYKRVFQKTRPLPAAGTPQPVFPIPEDTNNADSYSVPGFGILDLLSKQDEEQCGSFISASVEHNITPFGNVEMVSVTVTYDYQ